MKKLFYQIKTIKKYFGKNKSKAPILLYLAMAEYSYDIKAEDRFTITQEQLKDLSGISQRSIADCIYGLQSCGIIEVYSGRSEGHVTTSNTYILK